MRDLDADGVPCRLYRPADAAAGVVVHLHGGGFVFHDVDVHDAAAAGSRTGPASRCSASTTGGRRSTGSRPRPTTSTTVVALAGRAMPTSLGLDGPTYVHGDSAGGNLALVAALRHPGRFARGRADLPVPRPDRRASTPTAPQPTASTRARRPGTGSSTPRPRPTSTHPDLAPLLLRPARTPCRRRWWSPPSTTRCATRASSSRRRLAEAGVEVVGDPLPRPDARLLAARPRCSRRPSR